MAKRSNSLEKPYRPVSNALVRSVANPQPRQHHKPRCLDKEGEEEVPALNKLSKAKRYLLSKTEESNIEQFVSILSKKLGTSLSLSNVVRACIHLLIEEQNSLLLSCEYTSNFTRPPNGDLNGVKNFEKRLAKLLKDGLQKDSTT